MTRQLPAIDEFRNLKVVCSKEIYYSLLPKSVRRENELKLANVIVSEDPASAVSCFGWAARLLGSFVVQPTFSKTGLVCV